MKKVFCSILMLTACSFCAFAEEPDTEDHDPSFIITDCGTVHPVPSDWSDEQRAAELDKRTIEDCMYGFKS